MQHAKYSSGFPNRSAGITMVELMIALVIVSMLTMVAYPSFMQSIRKSKRADAHTAITRVTAQQERFFSNNGSYTADVTKLGLDSDGGIGMSDDGLYRIYISGGGTGNIEDSYRVIALADPDGMQWKDYDCIWMMIDSTGRQYPDPSYSKCW